LFVGRGLEQRRRWTTGVGDEDVDRSENLGGGGQYTIRLAGDRHIARDGKRAPLGRRRNVPRLLFQQVFSPSDHRYAGPFLTQLSCDRESKSR
jgi:hypothetical protein